MFEVEYLRDVLPGDEIKENGTKSLGIREGKAAVAGQLCKIQDLCFVRSKTNNYTPEEHDVVIGRIIYSSQDYYKVDLGGAVGYLPSLSFYNATKRNRPDLQKNDWVLAQVVRVQEDVLLSCAQEGFGQIDEAFQFDSWKIRLLYFGDLLVQIAKERKFKIAMGLNGYLWIDADPLIKRDILDILKAMQ
ncbi:exosome complex component RRP40 [Enteropsectra breve]|nr:exosome complex component RRP40 [Enteropsectra breve]